MIFKAEVGAATPQACQVQGVWVRPEFRGQGLAAPGMAAVVDRGPPLDLAGRVAVRQRLQRPGPRRLPPGRLP